MSRLNLSLVSAFLSHNPCISRINDKTQFLWWQILGLSKYRKDTQTSQRQTKTRKDGQRHAKTGKDAQRHPKMAKRRLKLTKTHKDGQRHSNKAKRCLKLSKIDKDTQRRQKIFIVDKDTRKIEEKKAKMYKDYTKDLLQNASLQDTFCYRSIYSI